MIESLHIANYALIDQLDIDFDGGLNIITGETGAGKSIMLGALSLLLGGRADTKVVRDATRKSVIEATFTVSDYAGLKEYFASNEMEWDDNRCILRREIAPTGRSRAFVNDSPVNLAMLRGVALQLVDIHSQHQNQLLATPEFQLEIIDCLAETSEKLSVYRQHYEDYRRRRRKLIETREMIAKNASDAEYIRFQLDQLRSLNLQPDEQAQLEQERDTLANMTGIKQSLQSLLSLLSDGTHNALSMLEKAADECNTLAGNIDSASELSERLESATIEVRDIVETLQDYDENLQADPERLESVDERLNDIYSLQRKHHVDTVEELINIQKALARKLRAIANSDDTLDELRRLMEEAQEKALALAEEISSMRKKAASEFSERLKATALPLGMKNLKVEIAVNRSKLNINGCDNVEFLFAFNKNQTPMPVGLTASGGEISRLMLSIKALIGKKMQLPSIIFDEVDTGVSGDVANRMGDMMRDISSTIQVITITHLPQVAAKGRSHYKVYKEDNDIQTMTRVRRLDEGQRISELALMLSGSETEPTALAAARALIEDSEKRNN